LREVWTQSSEVPPVAATRSPVPHAPRPTAGTAALNGRAHPGPFISPLQPQTSRAGQAGQKIGRVTSVAGAVATIELDPAAPAQTPPRAEIGSLAKIRTRAAHVVGIISALSQRQQPAGGQTIAVEIIQVGELVHDGQTMSFTRGVAHFPSIGDDAFLASREDLAVVYGQGSAAALEIGALYQDPSVPANLLADELFSKHFAIVGTTGCGKSSALACILHRALERHQHAHVIVLDMHGEYHRAFGAKAEVFRPGNLYLPFWLLNFQELRSVLTSTDDHHDAQCEILCDAIVVAKRRYADAAAGRLRNRSTDMAIGTVDSPTPFRLSDVTAYIDEQLGKLERPYPTLAYRRLKLRIEALASDPRFGFMFGNPNMEDTMVDLLAQLYRVPGDGKPITVIELSTVPEEILDVVILLISRLTFDLAVWSDGGLPMLLVCEEAHRYIPADDRRGFLPTRQSLSRIAKEGRKYGISLALLTQRPSELDTTILSQCSTLLAMRLATESDQKVMRANVHDSTFGILEYLPLLADREAIVLGCGTPMPMRIKLNELAQNWLPGSGQIRFMDRWARPNMDRHRLEETVLRWRGRKP
jgi:DNA helicase HerA-like ATPase